jgi:O-antigen/teichoic acid export membrane protein
MSFTRRLASGTFQLTISNGVVRLLAIVTMPILTALLGPQTYGIASLVATAISLASVLALAGIDMSYARAYHSVQQPSGTVVEHYCWRFAMFAALLTSMLAAGAWWFINRDAVELDHRLAILLALGIAFVVTNTMAQTRARLAGKYRVMALSIIAAGIIGPAASIGIAVWWRQDVLALVLPLLLSYLISMVLLGTPSIACLVKPSNLARGEGAALVKIGLAGIVTAPMYWLLSSSDRWFLQYYQGAEAVGVYSVGCNVAMVGMMVNTAVISVWLPEASREYEKDREQAKVILGKLMSGLVAAMALIWLMATAAGGDIVRWLTHERFHASAEFVPFIAGAVFFNGVFHLANTGLLLMKKLNYAALWWLGGGVVSALLNLTLVPILGGLGAAITQSMSFALISFGVLATSQSMFPVHLSWSRLAIILAIIVAAGVLMIPPWHGSALFSLLMKLPIGIVVAAITAWVVVPEWCVRGINCLRVIGRPRPAT